MLQHSSLDGVFRALADPTRRALVERLSVAPASVSELAMPFSVSLTAIGQHLNVLETSGLVRTRKVGRVRTVELVPDRLAVAERWFASHRERWERRLDRLGALLAEEDDEGVDEEVATNKRRRKKK
jgi:DNA-binding transcriptional ArsR family regulator